jgi:hypothetical protein
MTKRRLEEAERQRQNIERNRRKGKKYEEQSQTRLEENRGTNERTGKLKIK